MKRSKMIRSITERRDRWDIIVIGGGATGLGTAVDAASRGYDTLLLEKGDFACGTSSRSTKLIHGGVRYLQQGNISLVFEALRERRLLMQNAPHLVHRQSFLVPHFSWWKGIYYWTGLKLYDLLAGKSGIGTSKFLNAGKTLEKIPNLKSEKLRGGVLYYDGQFDDARLAVNLARTGAREGSTLVNYMKVKSFLKDQSKIRGVKAVDLLSGETYEIEGRSVINATGVFADRILQMDDPGRDSVITQSQGIHIVVEKKFLSGDTAMLIPETRDGRVLFVLPWQDKILIGTTDTPVDDISAEPEALDGEIDYLLNHASDYLDATPSRSDIKSIFAGLRPLVKSGDGQGENTAYISRDHSLFVDPSGLVTITGGKWTTYRKMAEDVVDRVSSVAGLEQKSSVTDRLRIHGWTENGGEESLDRYGSDKAKIKNLVRQDPALGERLHERLPYIKAEVIWAVRNEMAVTVEDFNSRRTRALFLDAEASVEMAPEVARLMAGEAGHDEQWIHDQIADFKKIARSYQAT